MAAGLVAGLCLARFLISPLGAFAPVPVAWSGAARWLAPRFGVTLAVEVALGAMVVAGGLLLGANL